MTDCGHAPDGTYTLCLPCMRGLQSVLTECLAEFEALDPSLNQGAGGGPSHQKPKSKSPANDHVISLTDSRVAGTYPRLLRDVMTRFGHTPYPTVRGNYNAVMGRMVMISKQDWAPGFLRDVRHCLVQLRRANGERPRNRIGTCDCGAPLYAPRAGFIVECESCEIYYDVTDHVERITGG